MEPPPCHSGLGDGWCKACRLLPWTEVPAKVSAVVETGALVLVSGKGSGPFSGPAGATRVASEFAKLLKAYRVTPQSAGKEK